MTYETRFFSLEEANALIPELENRLQFLIHKRESYTQKHDELLISELLAQAEHRAGKKDNPFPEDQEVQGLENSIVDFENELKALQQMGCLVRSFDQGLVEFPGRWKEQEVYFSWKLGEKQISFYRVLKPQSTERQPL